MDIIQVVSDLKDARINELEAIGVLADGEADLKREEASALYHGREDGTIIGKTVSDRAESGIIFLATHPGFQGTLSGVKLLRHTTAEARIERQYQEDLLSAMKAVLAPMSSGA
jgi:GNAT superfamily N-acetyltransferase